MGGLMGCFWGKDVGNLKAQALQRGESHLVLYLCHTTTLT